MKVFQYPWVLCAAGILMAVLTGTSRAEALGMGARPGACAGEFQVTTQELDRCGFVMETLVSLCDLSEAARNITRVIVESTRQAGRRGAARAFFNRVAGVLAGYDPEPPNLLRDRDALAKMAGGKSAEISLLAEILAALVDYGAHDGENAWISSSLAAAISVAPTTNGVARILLKPGSRLWRAPGYSAEAVPGLAGPVVLFLYHERRQSGATRFYEVGTRAAPENAPYVGFARAEDAIPWPRFAERARCTNSALSASNTLCLTEVLNGAPRKAGGYAYAPRTEFPVSKKEDNRFVIRAVVERETEPKADAGPSPFIAVKASP